MCLLRPQVSTATCSTTCRVGYIDVHYTTFQPRVGIAYQLDGKTVLRSGFGRYMNRQGVSDGVFEGGIPPVQQVAGISNGSADNPGGTATRRSRRPTPGTSP